MATLKEGLSGLNAEGMVAKADFVHAKLTANAATFATPSPSLAALKAGRDTLSAAISAAEDGGRSAHQAKRDALRSLKELLKDEADYVSNVASGDAQKILDGGYELRSSRTPSNRPSAPEGLEARSTGYTGTVGLEWKGVANARFYQVYITDKDPSTGSVEWSFVGSSTKRQYTFTDLVSLKAYWFVVVAVNPAGASPYSDVIMGRAA
jgi:Fibronectin type III domain